MTVPAHEGPARGRGSDRDVSRTTHTSLHASRKKAVMRQPRIPVFPTEPARTMTRRPPHLRPKPNLTERRRLERQAPQDRRHRLAAARRRRLHGRPGARHPQHAQYDAGQSGQAERVLNQVAPAQYNAKPESVLIQAKTPGATFATDPAMRQAAPRSRRRSPPCPATRRTSGPRCSRGPGPGVEGRAQRPGHLPGSRQRHR